MEGLTTVMKNDIPAYAHPYEGAPVDALARTSPADVPTWHKDDARRAVDEANEKYAGVEGQAYVLGGLLNAMRERGAAEALGYATWDEMVDAELRVPKTTAYRFMRVAQAFTAEEFKALGTSRADVLTRLSSEQRAPLLLRAKSLSARALADLVSDVLRPTAAVASEAPAVVLGLREEGGTIRMTRLGDLAAVGQIPAIGGALQIALGVGEDGCLELHVTPITGTT